MRTLATVGGTVVAGGWESELLAGLLAHDAAVHLAAPGPGTQPDQRPLAALLADPQTLAGRIITAVDVCTDGRVAVARTGRTPRGTPIVAAVARRDATGTVRVAMSGVAATPVVVDHPAALRPPGDFRGSPGYRAELAAVLHARVTAEVAA
jgi:CO/xanthine dehydrogenase FAD-binding subunit